MTAPLAGLVVVERAGGLATAATGYLLASLGAEVRRIEPAAERARLDAVSPAERRLTPAERRLTRGDKVIVAAEGAGGWSALRAAADVLLLDPPAPGDPDAADIAALIAAPVDDTVVCVVSPAGIGGTELPVGAPEPLIQAVSGVMGVTGYQGGPPEPVRVPVCALGGAVLAATAVLAALQARARDGQGQRIDLSLVEVMADQLRTFVASVGRPGRPGALRAGCRHPVTYPWNCYRAADGWLLICTSSDAQWRKLLDLIGRPALKDDPRMATAALRRPIADEVDALIQEWVGARPVATVLDLLSASAVPVGAARRIPDVVRDPLLRARGTIRSDGRAPVIGRVVHLRDDAGGIARDPVGTAQAGDQPLAGLRVVEITRFAAGPIAGLVLASLGAEVIKIESPGGEECRRWMPGFGVVSGYYVNHNAGKRSVVLDLRRPDGRRGLEDLVAGADVLLQNVRPGVMDEIGLGAVAATRRFPRLVYASLNGYGIDGPPLAALDTVIQAEGGLTSLIGNGEVPCRMGFSIADQLAGHITALGILAALRRRAATGRGGIVDTAMGDAIAWLTQLAWPDGDSAIGPWSRWPAADGWVVAAADAATAQGALDGAADGATRADLVARLAGRGIAAAPVLEPSEVFAQPLFAARGSLYEIETEGGGRAPVLAPPLGLTRTPVLRSRRLPDLGEDNDALLGAARAMAE